jgi:hypothetical protein
MDSETNRGLEYLRDIFESGRILKLGQPVDINRNGFVFYFNVRAFDKMWPFTVRREVLDDLPGMRQYAKSANLLARSLEKRFKNVSPHLFLTGSGRLIRIEHQWPMESLQGPASCVRTKIYDNMTREFANAYLVITHQQSSFELKNDPFQLHCALINSVRKFVDSGGVKFYSSEDEHPDELQKLALSFGARVASPQDPSEFLKHKVELMGFRAGNRDTQVWIADPWDAEYLGVALDGLRQEAEILEAGQYLNLCDGGEFATSNRSLLLELRGTATTASAANKSSISQEEYDVFLSHSHEDKSFVRELASALDNLGISYWLDEMELRLGDSLRAVIDHGLKKSRFGVVILSKHFFAKQWPQRELDGLLAKEIDSKVILPVWHGVDSEDVRKFSPMLAGRYAAISKDGANVVAEKIRDAIHSP